MIDFLSYITLFFQESWSLILEMGPYLLIGMIVSGIITIFVDDSFILRHIGNKNFNSIFKSTVFGIPLPLCSCGVIPVAASLRSSGASKGSTVSFLVSTPQTGVDSILLTYGMLGPSMALFRPLAAFLSGLLSGLVVNIFDKEKHSHLDQKKTNRSIGSLSLSEKMKSAMEYGFLTLPSDIVVPLFQGLFIAVLISIHLPPQFIADNFSNYLLLPAMLIMSIPLYVCATASIPIAVALMSKGVTVGAVFVFLMAGPATNASSITVIRKILGDKVLFQYLAMISLTSLLLGFLLDNFFNFNMTLNLGTNQHSHDSYWQIFIGILFLVVMLNSYVYKKTNFKVQSDSSEVKAVKGLRMRVDGMTCSHCVSAVKNAVFLASGVENVGVDLDSGEILIPGTDHDQVAIQNSIVKAGFSIK